MHIQPGDIKALSALMPANIFRSRRNMHRMMPLKQHETVRNNVYIRTNALVIHITTVTTMCLQSFCIIYIISRKQLHMIHSLCTIVPRTGISDVERRCWHIDRCRLYGNDEDDEEMKAGTMIHKCVMSMVHELCNHRLITFTIETGNILVPCWVIQ